MARKPTLRVPGRSNVRLDLSGPEWNWLVEQAMALGIPFSTHVRSTLGLAAPAGQDKAHFDATRRALFEARQAVFGFLRRVIEPVFDEFEKNPRKFIPENHGAPPPEMLASLPAWDEPDDQGGHLP